MGRGQGGGGGKTKLAGGGGASAGTLERAAAGEYVDPGIANDTLDPTLLGQMMTGQDINVIADYTGMGFQRVNAYLEGFPMNGRIITADKLQQRQKDIIANLPPALSKLPAAPGRTYRKLDFKNGAEAAAYAKQFTTGEGVNIKGFFSTTRDKKVFGNDEPGRSGQVFFVVNGKRGRDVSSYSAVSWEKETLFTRDSKFAVTKVTQRSTGAYEIHLEQ